VSGSAHGLSAISACETLATETEYKLLAGEKTARALHNSTAITSFMRAKTHVRVLAYSTKAAAHYGQFILVKSVSQFLFYMQQQR